MTQESKRGRSSRWWTLPGAAALALMVLAVALALANPWAGTAHAQTATPTATRTPAPTATANPECDLNVTKSDSPTTVAEGGQITYTIKIENQGDENGACGDLTVTDTIPTDTDCVSATDDGTLDFDIDGCDSSGDVVWDTNDELDDGDEVVVTMVVKLTSGAEEDDEIENEACAVSSDDVGGDCDSERTDVGPPATATPTTAPTATMRPPTVQPPVAPPPVAPPPVVAPLPTVRAPATGSGADAGGSGTAQTLALTLGLLGAGLLLVSGVAFAKRTR